MAEKLTKAQMGFLENMRDSYGSFATRGQGRMALDLEQMGLCRKSALSGEFKITPAGRAVLGE